MLQLQCYSCGSRVAGQPGGSKVAGPKGRFDLAGPEWWIYLTGQSGGSIWRVCSTGKSKG
jgi:hypothetical protein